MRTHALTLAATFASLAITQTCRADVPANGWNLHWQQCLPSYTTNQGFAAFNALTAPENAATGTIERFDENLSSWKRQVTIWRQPCPAADRFPAVFVRIHTLEDGPGTGFLTIYAVDLKLVQPAYLQFPTQPASMAMCSNIVDCGRAIVSQTSVTTAGNTFTFLLAHGFDQAFRLDQPFQFGWESAVGTVTVPSAVDEFTVFANGFE